MQTAVNLCICASSSGRSLDIIVANHKRYRRQAMSCKRCVCYYTGSTRRQ